MYHIASLYIVIFLLTVLCAVACRYAYRFAIIILNVQEDIESSLDELDESFKSLNTILEKPIFFDSVEVRSCINEIKKTRDVIVRIAERLTSFGVSKKTNIGDEIEK